jgi:Flp pilus assembly CpaE family ATPase
MSNWQSSYRFSANPQGKSHAAGGRNSVDSESSQYLDDQYPDSFGGDVLSIALIGPDEERRKAATTALAGCQGAEIREFPTYPPSLDDVPKLLEQHFDVIIIDLDARPEYALELVESICAKGAATVMVYSMKADSELLVRCMRAGAREFLTLPFARDTMAEALVRASARRPTQHLPKKTGGRLMAFLGAKGGDGVTTLACNFAVSMALESGQSTLLIDLDLPLGDAALNMGVATEYSTINALQSAGRLDSSFLSKLLVKHSSGVSVLAAPGKFPQYHATDEAIDRLISVARQDFDNVVVDMGSRLDLTGTSLFKDGSTIYLVIQAGIAGLRNANRLITQFFSTGIPKLEIVINRYEHRAMGVPEDQITKALTRPVQWKIPNDYNAVRRMQATAVPLALEDLPISRLIREMARTACGLPPAAKKQSGFSLKSFSRGISSRRSSSEEVQSSITQLGLTSREDQADVKPDATAKRAGKPVQATDASPALTAGTQGPYTPTDNGADSTELSGAKRDSLQNVSAPNSHRGEGETRSYKGATYVKGADGEWHIKKPETSDVAQETPTIAWPTPAPIAHGTALSAAQLNAAASVPGSFVYAPAEGDVLTAGAHTLSVTFTPTDAEGYTTAEAEVSLTVTKGTPAIAWSTPAPIHYGTALSATQLNALASVPGKFVYTPAAGDVLASGVHTLEVTFTPTNGENYATAQATVLLTVTKAAPAISWPTPAPIAYGTALSATQLNAAAPVPGKFVYAPAEGDVLTAGTHTLAVTFIPTDSTNHPTAQAEVLLTVTKAAPTISWSTPAPITYGTALSVVQLNATAPVPGKFVYTPAMGDVLTAGDHTLAVTFTPTDSANHPAAQGEVQLTVTQATPTIKWLAPASMIHGTALSTTQLNATASVPGKFVYTPAAGEVLTAGTHTLEVSFTPTDSTDYTAVKASVSLTITKGRPAITWPKPASIAYGTPLSATQLNAAASVSGKFVYIPAAGAVLSAGTHTPSVTFTPTDVANYTMAQAAVSLTVAKATPVVTWPTPAAIAYGTALSADQLNATASVPGRFVYTPAAGEVFSAGTHTLSVTFTPTDGTDYAVVQATVTLTVAKAKPTMIAWPTPAAISHGTALSATQLNATAPLPGKFVYTPAAGEVLATGTHTLSVSFTPTDANFPSAQATVLLVVAKAMPTIKWPTPAAISYGTALSATQLNATASVPGKLVYTPAAGEVLAAGTHTLSAAFTPKDSVEDAAAQATVQLTVTKATPIIAWPTPAPIAYGTALSATQLNATALIQGTFAYTPAAGTVIAAGTQTLSVTFTPTEITNYTTAQASTSLVVEGLPNIDSLMPATVAADADRADQRDAKRGASQSGSTPNQQDKLETRSYKGATYVKGADGQWYLQKK